MSDEQPCVPWKVAKKYTKHYHYDIKRREKKEKARKNCLVWYVISMIEK